MDAVVSLLAIIAALLVGVVSPGPSFVLVARTAIAASRRDGLAAALGMGLGGVAFGSLALLGVATLLLHAGWLYVGLKLAGGLYLVYLGIMIWRGAGGTVSVAAPEQGERRNAARSFWIGL